MDLQLAGGLFAIAIVGGLFFAVDNAPEGYYGIAQRLALAGAAVWVGALTLGLLDLYGWRRFFGSVRKTTSQIGEETP